MSSKYVVTGVMSGSSCDGLDMACCEFTNDGGCWTFRILATGFTPYDEGLSSSLLSASSLDRDELKALDINFGKFIASELNKFHRSLKPVPFLIGCHGHTVYHEPDQGISFQAGHGGMIATSTGINTITAFRELDIALGGQGAPLVPAGDKLLFSEYDYCLNLGGIANISFDENDQRIAFDICPANLLLNHVANRAGLPYDDKGSLAASGNLVKKLLEELNSLAFYRLTGPRSIDREWFSRYALPVIGKYNDPVEDLLHTCCEHVAEKIALNVKDGPADILITGGGYFNEHLIGLLEEKFSSRHIRIPDVPDDIVNYKEALVFAFLALLRHLGKENTYSSVTGAACNSAGGCYYMSVR